MLISSSSLIYSQQSFYELDLKNIDGESINFNSFKGKFVLFVNVASKCGFTPQYKALEELYNEFKDKLIVVGVPCNQFGGQEPKDESEIKEFCSTNYGVSFLLTEKIDVRGGNKHPLYQWLTQKDKNGISNSNVKWNFQKYLVSDSGELINYFYSTTSPKSSKITSILTQ
jgi:glutathione peroxidase|tara:strand:+ start:60626 stop:61135 length:510 start_codon:yes stop_codon:yes gene_type:complete